jgi:hypothetical protein
VVPRSPEIRGGIRTLVRLEGQRLQVAIDATVNWEADGGGTCAPLAEQEGAVRSCYRRVSLLTTGGFQVPSRIGCLPP